MHSTSPQKPNLAARMGRWSSQHRKLAIGGWIAFVVLALLVGSLTGMRMLTGADSMTGESAAAQKTLTQAGFGTTAGESVLVQSSRLTIADPALRAVVADTERAVLGLPWISRVRSPLQAGNGMLVSRDRHSALVQFEVSGDAMQNME